MRNKLHRDIVASPYTSEITRTRFSFSPKDVPIFNVAVCNYHPNLICLGGERELGKSSIDISFPFRKVSDGILRGQKSFIDGDRAPVVRNCGKCFHGVFRHFIIEPDSVESGFRFQQYGWRRSHIFYRPATGDNLAILKFPVFHGNEVNKQPRPFCGFHMFCLQESGFSRIFGGLGLPVEYRQSAYTHADASKSSYNQGDSCPKSGLVITIFCGGRDDPYIGVNALLMCGLAGLAAGLLWHNRRDRRGWFIAFCFFLCLIRLSVSLHREDRERQSENRQYFQHNSAIVPPNKPAQNSFGASCLPIRRGEAVYFKLGHYPIPLRFAPLAKGVLTLITVL